MRRSGPARARRSTCATSARSETRTDIITGYAQVNGRRTVYIPVTKRADASTLDVINACKSEPAGDSRRRAGRRKIGYEFDQSRYVVERHSRPGRRRAARAQS